MEKEETKVIEEQMPTEVQAQPQEPVEKIENSQEKPEKKEEEVSNSDSGYPHPSLQKVEDVRSVFWKSYKIHNTLKMVVMMICLAAIIVAFIVFPNTPLKNTPKLQTGLTIGVAILALGGTYGYSLYVRKKFERKMREYFELYFNCCNEYVYGEKGFSDVELQNPGKINLDEFNECGLYKDVIETGSRGLTTFKYHGIESSIVDCAGNIKAEKRMKPAFVGKMVRASAKYEGDIPVIVYLKGNDRALPPTNLEGIHNVLENEQLVVYSEYKDWKKILNGPVMKAIEGIKTGKLLVDVAISIKGGKVFVMLGYDDPLMVLPLQTTFNSKPTESYKKDMDAVCKLIEALNK